MRYAHFGLAHPLGKIKLRARQRSAAFSLGGNKMEQEKCKNTICKYNNDGHLIGTMLRKKKSA